MSGSTVIESLALGALGSSIRRRIYEPDLDRHGGLRAIDPAADLLDRAAEPGGRRRVEHDLARAVDRDLRQPVSGTSTSTTSDVRSITSITPGVPNPGDTPSPTLTSLFDHGARDRRDDLVAAELDLERPDLGLGRGRLGLGAWIAAIAESLRVLRCRAWPWRDALLDQRGLAVDLDPQLARLARATAIRERAGGGVGAEVASWVLKSTSSSWAPWRLLDRLALLDEDRGDPAGDLGRDLGVDQRDDVARGVSWTWPWAGEISATSPS